jgi:hypothetical protein
VVGPEDVALPSFHPVLERFGRLDAEDLARRYDEHLAAVWRGEAALDNPFARWLDSCWAVLAQPEPSRAPDATSVLGAGGAGIRWYEIDDIVVGFIGERTDGCYRIPVTSTPPPRAKRFAD